jgi:epoxyqueuosine reductase
MRPAASAKQIIRECAWNLGIDGLASCDAGPLEEAREAYEAAIRAGLIPEDSAPHPSTVVRMTTPTEHLKGARSVISAFECYKGGDTAPADRSRGVISAYTRANYYLDLKLRLKMLADFMEREFGCRTKVFSCYVTLAEKPLAAKTGVGFYGKHGVIITPTHGSYVVLGELITDLDLEPDAPSGRSCGPCTRCIDECPTGAITEPYVLDRKRCIQYLSERNGVIPWDVREAWSNRLYGCSICQDVCPHNTGPPATSREVIFGRVGASLPIQVVMDMDEDSFSARFRNNQIGMRDRNAIRRNAVIAAGNSGLDLFLPLLNELARDGDPMIRLHSLWAMAKIAGRQATGSLERALKAETDPVVLGEIKSLLDGLGGFA